MRRHGPLTSAPFSLLVFSLVAILAPACSESPGGAGAGGGDGGAAGGMGSAGGGGSGGGADAGGSSDGGSLVDGGLGADTEGCPTVPPGNQFPIVGPWFAGPHPGPCTEGNGADQTTYQYDQAGVLVGSTGETGDSTYVYDEDGWLIRVESDIPDQTFERMAGGAILYTGASITVLYRLDERNYVQTAEVTPIGGGESTLHVYRYDGCRILGRENTSVEGDAGDQVYVYDGDGNLIRIESPEGATIRTFDYACW